MGELVTFLCEEKKRKKERTLNIILSQSIFVASFKAPDYRNSKTAVVGALRKESQRDKV